MQNGEDHDCIVILFRNGKKGQISVFVIIKEMVVFVFDDGSTWKIGYLSVY